MVMLKNWAQAERDQNRDGEHAEAVAEHGRYSGGAAKGDCSGDSEEDAWPWRQDDGEARHDVLPDSAWNHDDHQGSLRRAADTPHLRGGDKWTFLYRLDRF